MIDTHAHTYADDFSKDLSEVISNAKIAGVKKICMPNIDSSSIEAMYQVERDYPDFCHSMMGLHPCSVKENYLEELANCEAELKKRSFIAIGEIGLDYYWDKNFVSQQNDAFRTQISWAKELNIPFVVHSRDSINECLDIVEEMQDGSLTGIFHCFGGTLEELDRIKNVGFLAGLGGVVTFKKVTLRNELKKEDFEHIVLETDSPYLAPVPFRGKRNESSYLSNIVSCLSDATSLSEEYIIEKTNENAFKLFPSLGQLSN